MKKYIGTKQIEAKPMNRGDYNKHRGWNVPDDENPNDEGYLVKYKDGYVSWSPKKQFEEAYRISGEMNFGHAIEMLKCGCRVARKGWNGKDMFIFLAKGNDLTSCLCSENMPPCTDSICMKTADDKICVGWLASQTDILAEDWTVVE